MDSFQQLDIMPPAAHRGLDYLFFGYFLLQIPTTLLFDTQGVYPEYFYPGWLKAVRSHYLQTYKDPFLADAWKHPWYLAICLAEHFIEMPFFIWATISYHHGALLRPRIIIPSIIYSSHTLTSVTGIWFTALLSDFSQSQVLAPATFAERLTLCSAYAPFFFVSLIMLVDSVRICWKEKFD